MDISKEVRRGNARGCHGQEEESSIWRGPQNDPSRSYPSHGLCELLWPEIR